jgi:hypothetical protein
MQVDKERRVGELGRQNIDIAIYIPYNTYNTAPIFGISNIMYALYSAAEVS